ncbi:MAG TPA: SpoIIE family protein phosphatase [Terriglobales bacterium]|nr:SpoIIE family protein phosphatase [Terriglobales bacterium]
MNKVAEMHGGVNPGRPIVKANHPRRGHLSSVAEVLRARNQALEGQLAAVSYEREQLFRALADAALVQKKLSAPRQLRRGDFEIAGECFPAQHVSGDLITILEVGERTVFAIGDICGKGLFAGMWFTHLAGLLRCSAESLGDPARVVNAINGHFSSLPEPPLATLFVGSLDTQSGELIYCNAGHPSPLLLCAEGRLEPLSTGGPVLGALSNAEFRNGRAVIGPAETLIGYSDGVVECRNRRGEDFDAMKLAVAARTAAQSSANSILFSVLGATQDFAGTQPRTDDVALIVVHRRARSGCLTTS